MTNKITVKYNFKAMELAINKSIEGVTLPIARKIASDHFNDNLNNFIKELENDDVTKELKEKTNISHSKFIKGVGSRKHGGDLFSFFGFEAESDPVEELIAYIKNNFKISKTARLIKNQYTFRVKIPSEQEIKSVTPLHWIRRSWLTAVENGLSNIVSYIKKDGLGRSEGGVQINREIKKVFRNKPGYFSNKYKNFIRKLSNKR